MSEERKSERKPLLPSEVEEHEKAFSSMENLELIDEERTDYIIEET